MEKQQKGNYSCYTSDNSFGTTEISYLEHRFYNLAKDAKRYKIKNCNDPTPGNVTEEKECELEEFIGYAKVIMGTLVHPLFEPFIKAAPPPSKTLTSIVMTLPNCF